MNTLPERRYTIVETKQFRKDVKRMQKSGYDRSKLERVFDLLREGKPLPVNFKQHPLKGDWSYAEECHVAPDWLLIYERHEREIVLVMLRTGTHSQLFKE